jgi:hypothetical protein
VVSDDDDQTMGLTRQSHEGAGTQLMRAVRRVSNFGEKIRIVEGRRHRDLLKFVSKGFQHLKSDSDQCAIDYSHPELRLSWLIVVWVVCSWIRRTRVGCSISHAPTKDARLDLYTSFRSGCTTTCGALLEPRDEDHTTRRTCHRSYE